MGEESRCDYLFCGYQERSGELWVVPIEMKGGEIRPTKVLKQLRGGAELVEKHWQGPELVQLHPVVVHRAVGHYHDVEALREGHVELFKLTAPVRLAKGRLRIPDDLIGHPAYRVSNPPAGST